MINEGRQEIQTILNQMVSERIGPYHSCYTDFCGSEFPEFTSTNPNHNFDLRFSSSVADTYSTANVPTTKTAKGLIQETQITSPLDVELAATPTPTAKTTPAKTTPAKATPNAKPSTTTKAKAKVTPKAEPDGWDCTKGAQKYGRTCKCITVTAGKPCRDRF